MATWNADIPAVGNEISADIPDIEENFQELHDVITAITNGTLGTTTASSFAVDSLADGTTGFASTTTQPFYQNSAPTGWTRNEDLTDNSMFGYAATGNPATGGAVNAKSAHTHTGPSHLHKWFESNAAGTSDQTWSSNGSTKHAVDGSNVKTGAANGIETAATGNQVLDEDGYTNLAGTGATGSNTAPYYIEMILAAVD